MSSLPDIEAAVRRLDERELAEFRSWFAEFDALQWDRQIERDAATGRLDALAQEAVDDLKAGRCTDL